MPVFYAQNDWRRMRRACICPGASGKKSHRLSTSRPKKVRLFRNGDGNFDVRTTVIQELFFVKFHKSLRKRRIVRNAKQFV